MTPNSAFIYNIEYLVSADALGHNSVVTPHSAFIYNIEYLVSADALGHNFVVTQNNLFSYSFLKFWRIYFLFCVFFEPK